jgi:glycogen debranching enzyme
VLRLGGFSDASRAEARTALQPLIDLLDGPSLGQLAEVFDGQGAPQAPGGCTAQAWSIAETLRVWLMSLSPSPDAPKS